ncbi:MAG: hypothetical protein ACLGPL_12205, partial [Acidobacteriota bacterium]
MKKSTVSLLLLAVLMMATAHGAMAQGFRGERPRSMVPIPARALLLVPYEFERYVYSNPYDDATPRLHLGEQAMDQFDEIIGSAFTSFRMKPVRSEAVAMEMMTPGDPDYTYVRDFDYVDIPRFKDVNAWKRGWEYGFDVDVVVDVYSMDRAVVTKIMGHGEAKSGVYGDV